MASLTRFLGDARDIYLVLHSARSYRRREE